MKKRPFFLFEALIALSLISLFFMVMVSPSRIFKSEVASVKKITYLNACENCFSEVRALLMMGKMPYNKIAKNAKNAVWKRVFAGELFDIFTKDELSVFYKIHVKNDKIKNNTCYCLLQIDVNVRNGKSGKILEEESFYLMVGKAKVI
jgi:hypothetical protein